ncbi:glycosyltransferase family A protein [Flavobacterium sp. LT1R49]|uniref:glycosyltransferase family A protein n=1 Tax=Flavobacterium arabinosi TaxID=3398737 RepID=UPI003A8459A3
MRIGSNPNKSINQEESVFIHQIIVPVYIPNEEGYFVDALKILKISLNSLFNTIHERTYITIVNNGSCQSVVNYLDKLFLEKKIKELIHTDNIGKINAVLKGLSGNNIELVTITDADVLFLPDWQSETTKVFVEIPKAGVVGIVPQLKMYNTNCGNVIFDNFFNSHLKFISVKNQDALIYFYESIGWGRDYNQDYLKLGLGLEYDTVKCFVGSGHFVATYKKDIFEELVTYVGGKKVAGIGEAYIDVKSMEKGYWRLTTHDNYAYHMGNVYEDWMEKASKNTSTINYSNFNFIKRKKVGTISYFVKNRLFVKFISMKWTARMFLKWKKLPKEMIVKY